MSNGSAERTSCTLLGRLCQQPNNQAAWKEFVTRYGPRIHQWCLEWHLQSADAQDVTQTVLLKLVQKMADFTYDPALSFRAWLKTVTQHVLSDFVAARRPQSAGPDSHAARLLENLEARAGLIQQLEGGYDQELLGEAMAPARLRVAPNKWEAFRLTAVEGLSGAEAAQRLGMRVATVYTAKSKVQQLVRAEVRKLDDSPD